MAQAVPIILQVVAAGAATAGAIALKKSLEPGKLKTPVAPEREEAGRRAARASQAERRRAGRRRGRGSTILTRGLLNQQPANVARQTLGGA